MSEFIKWSRRPGNPGHPEVLVYSFPTGEMAGEPRPGPRGTSEVQCFTTDRIPFCMPRKRLMENYERVM
jgi:hypothetical protein